MNQNTEQNNTLIEAWEALTRYRWRFLLATFGVTTGLLAASFLLPRKYKAEAVFERHTDMVLTEIINRGASKSFLDSQRSSLVEDIAGDIAIEQMIESLANSDQYAHLLKGKTTFELNNIRANATNRITVHFDIGTKEFDRIRVGFTHESRRMARAIVNTLVQNYITRTRYLIDNRLAKTASFFESEASRNRQLIEELENRKLTFEIDHAQLLPEFPGSIQLRLTEAQTSLTNEIQNRETLSMRLEALRSMIESTPAMVPQVITSRNPELESLETQMRDLRTQMEKYTGAYKMTGRHPDLIAIREQVAAIEHEIANTVEEVVIQKRLGTNRKREDLELNLANVVTSLKASENQIESLKDLISQLGIQSTQMFPVRRDYRQLTRQIEQTQRQQTFWEENLRHVQMALTAESGDRGVSLDFVKPCGAIHKPVSPNLMQVLMAALTMGTAVGCISVFLAYRSDDSFRSSDQITEAFSLPLMGSVSEIITKKQQAERRIRNLIFYPLNASAMATVLLVVVSLLYINLEKPYLYRQLTGKHPSWTPDTGSNDAAPKAVDKE